MTFRELAAYVRTLEAVLYYKDNVDGSFIYIEPRDLHLKTIWSVRESVFIDGAVIRDVNGNLMPHESGNGFWRQEFTTPIRMCPGDLLILDMAKVRFGGIELGTLLGVLPETHLNWLQLGF